MHMHMHATAWNLIDATRKKILFPVLVLIQPADCVAVCQGRQVKRAMKWQKDAIKNKNLNGWRQIVNYTVVCADFLQRPEGVLSGKW